MKTNRSAPTAAVVPILVYEDAGKAVEWLAGAFGFAERLRVEHNGVVYHAQLTFGGGDIMLGRQGGEFRPPRRGEVSQYVHISVDDVDAHFERARAFGAHIVSPPGDKPFGERQYTAEDPGGHRWTFSQHVADVAPEAWGARLASDSSSP